MSFLNWIRTIHFGLTKRADDRNPQVQLVRAEALLQDFLANRVRLSNRPYHAENLTTKAGEWLRNWDRRPYMPAVIKRVRDLAPTAIRSRLDTLREQDAARMLAEGRRKAAEVLARHSSKVDKFLEIAYRKVSAPDEYGDENPKALDEEIRRFLRKLAETELELRNRLVASRYGSPEGVVARSSC